MILKEEEIAKEVGLPYPPAKAELECDNYMVFTLQELTPIAKAQLKKVFIEIDKVYNSEDPQLALAYLHKALSEEVTE